jgi:hypothetical protein
MLDKPAKETRNARRAECYALTVPAWPIAIWPSIADAASWNNGGIS